ncbi:hypothetical protein BDN70DRAFT_925528 [Pholiota conissans]|uniref:Uncharacterized protein n=1 Tax=Pholiota conissans TaxID=109636 RepID=A0A9P6CU37_9AGAR|nr:hypothetical protein BDN70DRAFT_925528 [Pholiota conissans]
MYTVQSALPTAPFVPSPEEAKLRYYGIPSRPLFIARSSANPWVKPTGMDEYIKPSELRPVSQHRLCDVWDSGVSAAMDGYLTQHSVAYTSIDPVRIGLVTDPIAEVIIWVGIEPGSLSPERGIDVAVGLRAILLENDIEDVHVEIRASIVTTSAKMYKSVPSFNPTDDVREKFATTLGITICAEDSPDIQGTAALFFTVSKPNRLFLLAPRHVLFRVDEDNNWTSQECPLDGHQRLRLAGVDKIEDPEDAERERERIPVRLGEQERDIAVLERFLINVKKDWSDPKSRVLGHIVLSPPFIVNRDKGGFIQDLAVIEVDTTKIDASNFIGNVIDLGTEVPRQTLSNWMYPHLANQNSFKFPVDRLLHFHGVLSIGEMQTPDPKNVDSRGNPTIMVLKRGLSTGLTVGCLNNICSILRKPFKSLAGTYSMEFAVLPRSYKSGSFSDEGDSGAAVVNGLGAVAGMLTGSSGSSDASDCTYVTPMPFILDCLKEHKYPANILPVPAEAFV